MYRSWPVLLICFGFVKFLVLFYDLDCRILEFWPSVSCWSILWVLQDVTALICQSVEKNKSEIVTS